MKIKTIFPVMVLASVVFTACQSKSSNSTEEVSADSLSAVIPDDMMPDITLERTDGTKLQLSSLFGKTLYIDFWATWCPPCCAEIPHLESLYKSLSDNQDVSIISISADQDREAWVKKMDEDKPAWEQYRISSEDVDVFFSAIELETIPRFIVVCPDGSIINADAPRPSDESCADAILKSIQEAD
mgnify:FL=1